MRNYIFGICTGVLGAILVFSGYRYIRQQQTQGYFLSPVLTGKEKPLEKYSILGLSSRDFMPSPIHVGEPTEQTRDFTVYPFTFISDGKKVSGVAHVPAGSGPFPVIVQFRGYADPTIYVPGLGTKRSAEQFAKNGFISLAPDFLGFATSDPLSGDIFLDRFETYSTALTLMNSVREFPGADAGRVGIWGHSNGGQIAITVAEVMNTPYPVVLWAPVTKPFPYSILYYTDESDDGGVYLRKKLSEFETDYVAARYSLTGYLDRIKGTIQLHQGTSDDAVPVAWSDAFAATLKSKDMDVRYFVYPGADHNLSGSWNTVVSRDIEFFHEKLSPAR